MFPNSSPFGAPGNAFGSQSISTLCAQIESALVLMYSATTSPAQRQEANVLLASFPTMDPFMVFSVSLQLLSNPNNALQTRHFGFHSAETAIETSWLKLEDTQRNELRRAFLQLLLTTVTPPPPNTPSYAGKCTFFFSYQTSSSSLLASKFVKLIAMILRQDWPNEWSDFFPSLLQHIQQTMTQFEYQSFDHTLFLTELLTTMFSICGQPSVYLSNARRKLMYSTLLTFCQDHALPWILSQAQLVFELAAGRPDILTQFMPSWTTELTKIPSSNPPITTIDPLITNSQFLHRLAWYLRHTLQHILTLLELFASRLSMNALANNSDAFITILTTCLTVPQVCIPACTILKIVLTKTRSIIQFDQSNTLLRVWGTTLEVIQCLINNKPLQNDNLQLFVMVQNIATNQSVLDETLPIIINAFELLTSIVNNLSSSVNGVYITQMSQLRTLLRTATQTARAQGSQNNTIVIATTPTPTPFGLLGEPNGIIISPDHAMQFLQTEQQQNLSSIVTMLTGLTGLFKSVLDVSCQAALDPHIDDTVAHAALACLLECTADHNYQHYILREAYQYDNVLHSIMQRIWQVVLENYSIRPRIILLRKQQEHNNTSTLTNNHTIANKTDFGNNEPESIQQTVTQDLSGGIRSHAQTILRKLVFHSPHVVLLFFCQCCFDNVGALVTIANQERKQIETQLSTITTNNDPIVHANNTAAIFPSTIHTTASSIDYIFQTSSGFNQALYPQTHFGYHNFFISLPFSYLDSLASMSKMLFSFLQDQFILFRQISQTNRQLSFEMQQQVVYTSSNELSLLTDFQNTNEPVTHAHWQAVIDKLQILQNMLFAVPNDVLGYMTHVITILGRISTLYTTIESSVERSVKFLFDFSRSNPSNCLSMHHGLGLVIDPQRGVSYPSLFIDTEGSSPETFLITDHHAVLHRCDEISTVASSGRDSANFGPLVDMRRHALHVVLRIIKTFPQAFASSYKTVANAIFELLGSSSNQNQSSTSSTTTSSSTSTSTATVFPSELVSYIEILLSLALYYQDNEMLNKLWTQLLQPHCNYITSHPDILLFTAHPQLFATLLFGSIDEFKLIQLQLMQWDQINATAVQQRARGDTYSQIIGNAPPSTSATTQTTNTSSNEDIGDRIGCDLPSVSGRIALPEALLQAHGFDPRVQTLRRHFINALHTIQCVMKLLHTHIITGEVASPLTVFTSQKSNPGAPAVAANSAMTSSSSSSSDNDHASRLSIQAQLARQVVEQLVTAIAPHLLYFLVMFCHTTSETFTSAYIQRRQDSIASCSAFDQFLLMLSGDRYIHANPEWLQSFSNPCGIPPITAAASSSSSTTSTTIAPLLAAVPNQNAFNALWSGAAGPHPSLSGWLDAPVLQPLHTPLESFQGSTSSTNVRQTVIFPADKSQLLLRHLWSINESIWECLTQILNMSISLHPVWFHSAVVSCVVSPPSASLLVQTSPIDLLRRIQIANPTVLPQFATVLQPQSPLCQKFAQLLGFPSPNNASTPPLLSSGVPDPFLAPLSTSTPLLAPSGAHLAQALPQLWLALIGLQSSLPLRRLRLLSQRLFQAYQRFCLPLAISSHFSQFLSRLPESKSTPNGIVSTTQPTMPLPFHRKIHQNATTPTSPRQLIHSVVDFIALSCSSSIALGLSLRDVAFSYTYSPLAASTSLQLSSLPTLQAVSAGLSPSLPSSLSRLRGAPGVQLAATHLIAAQALQLRQSLLPPNSSLTQSQPNPNAAIISTHQGLRITATAPVLYSFQHYLPSAPFSGEWQLLLVQNPLEVLSHLTTQGISQQTLQSLQLNTSAVTQLSEIASVRDHFQTAIRREFDNFVNAQQHSAPAQQSEEPSTYLSAYPGQLQAVFSQLSLALSRFDISRSMAYQMRFASQQAVASFHDTAAATTASSIRNWSDGELNQFEHKSLAEVEHLLNAACSLIFTLSMAPLANERGLINAQGMLRRVQMPVALPLCSFGAELTAVQPILCSVVGSLFSTVLHANYGSFVTTVTRYVLSLLKYVSIVLSFSSWAFFQQQTQQQTPILDAVNMGLLYRYFYYQMEKDDPIAAAPSSAQLQAMTPEQITALQLGNTHDILLEKRQNIAQYCSPNLTSKLQFPQFVSSQLVIRRDPIDIITTLHENPSSWASVALEQQSFWMSLASQQDSILSSPQHATTLASIITSVAVPSVSALKQGFAQQQQQQQQQQQPNLPNGACSPIDFTGILQYGLTATFLAAAPCLYEWVGQLLGIVLDAINRHQFVSNSCSLMEKQAYKQLSVGSPLLDEVTLDQLVILARELIVVLLQTPCYAAAATATATSTAATVDTNNASNHVITLLQQYIPVITTPHQSSVSKPPLVSDLSLLLDFACAGFTDEDISTALSDRDSRSKKDKHLDSTTAATLATKQHCVASTQELQTRMQHFVKSVNQVEWPELWSEQSIVPIPQQSRNAKSQFTALLLSIIDSAHPSIDQK